MSRTGVRYNRRLMAVVLASTLASLAGSAAATRGTSDGGLSVQTDPAGAAVYLDGRFVGATPLTMSTVTAGDHRVRLVKEGYLEHSRVVRITAGKAEALELRLTARAGQAQASGLRIIVIEGEDGVNIIQQKTAVRPVVEVRDRNDLPVAGVVVVFSIGGGGGATFAGGATTTTVTTNAAGRAAVAELNPVSNGSFQINVEASYQGQTATTSINQTNFATPADAAQAAQAGQAGVGAQAGAVGGATGGAGGGLSALAITGIVGGAAAGTAIGLRAAGVIGGTDPCVFAVTPATINAPSTASSSTVNVSVSPSGCEPATWSASSGAAFATVNPGSGTGNGAVTVNIAANTGAQRTGTLTIANQTVTVTQNAVPCTFTVSPTAQPTAPSSASTRTVSIAVAPAGCGPSNWTATSNAAFLSVSPATGTGNGTVTISVAANAATTSRTGTVSVAGTTLTITQAGAAPPCNQQNVAGGDTPETRTVELGRSSGTFLFTYNTQNLEDRMLVIYEGRTLFDTGCVGTGSDRTQSITYSGTATQVQVQVIPNCRTGGTGTFWSFTVSCPQ